MALFNLFLLFVVCNKAVTSSEIDDLREAIAKVKNETASVESSNFQVQAEINEQKEHYESIFEQLWEVNNNDSKDLGILIKHINELSLKLKELRSERDTLTNHSIPELKKIIIVIESGMKWLNEDLTLLQNRSSDGDQEKCFRYLEYIHESESITKTIGLVLTRSSGISADEKDDIENAKLDLSVALSHLYKAERKKNRLNLKLRSDKDLFERELTNIRSDIEDVKDNLEKAKQILAERNDEIVVISKDLEDLNNEYYTLKKQEEILKNDAADAKSRLEGYGPAIACYNKIELFASE